MPEGDETQLEEEPAPAASDETQLEPAPPLATLTQLEPVAEEEEPDGTEIEENDETQLEAPPPPPPSDVETPQHIIGEEIINNLYSAHLNEKEFLDYILEVIRPSFEIFEYMYKQNSRKI